MKPIQLLSFFVILLSFCFCSCQKEIASIDATSDSTVNSNPFLVKTYSEDLYSVDAPDEHVKDSFKLSYDSKGRLTKMVEVDTTGSLQFIYQYNDAQQTFTLDQYESNALSLHEVAYLNASAYIDSTFQYDMSGDTMTEKYVYDATNHVTKLYEYDYSKIDGSDLDETISYEYDSNGNMTKQTDSEDNAVTTYTYTSRILNTLNMGMNFTPQNLYLPDVVSFKSNSETESATHVYTFDSQNRLTRDVTTLASGHMAIKIYGY